MGKPEGDGEETDLLSQRAEIFRSHLLRNFHLLESIEKKGLRRENPRLHLKDITGLLANIVGLSVSR